MDAVHLVSEKKLTRSVDTTCQREVLFENRHCLSFSHNIQIAQNMTYAVTVITLIDVFYENKKIIMNNSCNNIQKTISEPFCGDRDRETDIRC